MERKSLEQGLLEHLKYANVDKEKLREAVKTIVHVANSTQTRPMRVFTKGQPVPEIWGWWSLFDTKDQLLDYVKTIISDHPSINLDYFPYGIVNPEGWLVESKFGVSKGFSD